jgi:hypothetical protein
MTFQQVVNLYPAPGKEGDLASMNPTAVALPPEGSYKAGAAGVYQARWVWQDSVDATLVNNTGTGLPLGFVMNSGKGVIPVGEAGSMLVQPGTELAVFTLGDFFVRTSTASVKGQKIFAVLADGTTKTDDAGETVAGAVETPFYAMDTADTASVIKMTKQGVL